MAGERCVSAAVFSYRQGLRIVGLRAAITADEHPLNPDSADVSQG